MNFATLEPLVLRLPFTGH